MPKFESQTEIEIGTLPDCFFLVTFRGNPPFRPLHAIDESVNLATISYGAVPARSKRIEADDD